MTIKHYKFGGSTAKRTINCPAWVNQAEGIPRAPASQAAKLGTTLHSIIEQCLENPELAPEYFNGQTVEGVLITSEHTVSKIIPALDAFEDLIEEYDLEFLLEQTYELTKDVGGTPDFIGWSAEKNVVVMADYKSGDGIMVDAEGSDQLLFYVRIALSTLPIKLNKKTRLIMAIIQPTERRDYVVDIWETDLNTLNDWTREYDAALHESTNPNTLPNAGEWCKFCPAEATCPAKTGEAHAALRLQTDSMELAALNDAMKIVKSVEDWAAAVRKMAHEQAEQGVKIEGWKLVNKRASRVWNEPDAIAAKLKSMRSMKLEDYMNMKLMTPPQLEKICKQKKVDFDKVQDYISSVSSGTTLAVDSDKRAEIVPSAALKALADRL